MFSRILNIQSSLLLEVLHLSGSKFGPYAIHSHVHHEVLVAIQQVGQRIQRLFRNRIETNINHLKLIQHSQLIEQLNCSIISDTTLLQS